MAAPAGRRMSDATPRPVHRGASGRTRAVRERTGLPRAGVAFVWSVVLLTGALFAGIFVLAAAEVEPSTESVLEYLVVVPYTLFICAFAAVGALITTRHARNPIGWICLGAGFAYALAGFGDEYVRFAAERPEGPLPGAGWLLWTQALWLGGVGAVGCFLLLLFPTGSALGPRWRAAVWLAGAGVTAVAASVVVGPPQDYPGITNPLELALPRSLLDAVGGIGMLALALAEVAALASVVVRFKRSAGRERQQLKWLLYAAVVVVVCIALSVVAEIAAREELANILVSSGLIAIPMAIGVAMLRHRLYDIDLVINRTLVYGSLSAILALVYLGLVTGVSSLAGDSPVTVAASTLAVAALFQPLRRRVQGFIDRRFYRSKYDAQRTIDDFSSRLRDEVSLDSLTAHLLEVVQDTMQPARLSLWVRPPTSPAHRAQ
ncbi:MAG: hypothetical protein ABR575_01950 [Actinomycetota bacterium]